jgi:hypothetical protein
MRSLSPVSYAVAIQLQMDPTYGVLIILVLIIMGVVWMLKRALGYWSKHSQRRFSRALLSQLYPLPEDGKAEPGWGPAGPRLKAGDIILFIAHADGFTTLRWTPIAARAPRPARPAAAGPRRPPTASARRSCRPPSVSARRSSCCWAPPTAARHAAALVAAARPLRGRQSRVQLVLQ